MSRSHHKVLKINKTFPIKSVFRFHGSSYFGKSRKIPSIAFSVIIIHYRGGKHGSSYVQLVFMESLDHADETVVLEIRVSNVIQMIMNSTAVFFFLLTIHQHGVYSNSHIVQHSS